MMVCRMSAKKTSYRIDERVKRRKGLARALVPTVSHVVDLHGRLETLASDMLHPVYQVDAKYGKYLPDVYVNTRCSDRASSTNQGNFVVF